MASIIYYLSIGCHESQIKAPGANIEEVFECVKPSTESDVSSDDSVIKSSNKTKKKKKKITKNKRFYFKILKYSKYL